tara:strand:+ start:21292 stop:21504 length:213 start_codon:yes stop_codon:yes gene_type:complete
MKSILEINMMKGEILISKLGIKIVVIISGITKLTFSFLKNSISSKRLSIIPKKYIIIKTIKNLLRKFFNI